MHKRLIFNGQNKWGGSNGEEGRGVVIDATGNVYTTGQFNGTVDFDPGPGIFTLTTIANSDIFVSKLDASGNFIWAKKMGNISLSDEGNAIAIDANSNIVTTGYFSGTADFDPGPGTFNLISSSGIDIFISKLDPSGNFIWAKNVGGSFSGNDIGRSITTDPAGNVYTTGYFSGQGDFDPGPGTYSLIPSPSTTNPEIFILKLDATGNFVWAKNMGGIYSDYGFSIALDAAGNVYTTGTFNQTADFDPSPANYTLTTVSANHDIFISKLDATGNFVWAKQLGVGVTSTDLNKLTTDLAGNTFIIGSFNSTVDFDPGVGIFNMTSAGSKDVFILKLDASGNFVWAKQLGSNNNEMGTDIVLDGAGNIYSIGNFLGTGDFDPGAGTTTLTSFGNQDIFISKLDALGNFVWVQQIGGTAYEYVAAITVDASSNIYTTGFFDGTPDFDPGLGTYTMTENGGGDIFVHKLDQTPVGIKKLNLDNEIFNLYPNPANDELNISFNAQTKIDFDQVLIYNSIGQLIREEELKNNSINTKDLPNGVYLLCLRQAQADKSRSVSKRFVIAR